MPTFLDLAARMPVDVRHRVKSADRDGLMDPEDGEDFRGGLLKLGRAQGDGPTNFSSPKAMRR